MSLTLIAGPVIEPVTLAEAKLHCRVDPDITADDVLISSLIVAVREQAEHEIVGSIMPQTWERALDAFPADEIDLGRPPVQSITSVKYLDAAGADQTLSPSLYALDATTGPGWVIRASGASWPDTGDYVNAVRVRFVCGYANANAVPSSIKAWILLNVAEWYANRESASDKNRSKLKYTDGLLDRWRNWSGGV